MVIVKLECFLMLALHHNDDFRDDKPPHKYHLLFFFPSAFYAEHEVCILNCKLICDSKGEAGVWGLEKIIINEDHLCNLSSFILFEMSPRDQNTTLSQTTEILSEMLHNSALCLHKLFNSLTQKV